MYHCIVHFGLHFGVILLPTLKCVGNLCLDQKRVLSRLGTYLKQEKNAEREYTKNFNLNVFLKQTSLLKPKHIKGHFL